MYRHVKFLNHSIEFSRSLFNSPVMNKNEYFLFLSKKSKLYSMLPSQFLAGQRETTPKPKQLLSPKLFSHVG